MFKAARWRSEKNKVKAVFKFQFYVTQVPQVGWEAMVVSLVPVEAGKPSQRSEKAEVVNGACHWVKPVYETIRLSQDPKSGKINDKVFQFLISAAGSTKAGVLGEACINLADYAEVFKPSSVSLPLTVSTTTRATLHVTIQRIQGDAEIREDENGNAIVRQQRKTLQSQLSKDGKDVQSQLSNDSKDEGIKPANSAEDTNFAKEFFFTDSEGQPILQSNRSLTLQTDINDELRKSDSSDAISLPCSDSSVTPRNPISSLVDWSFSSAPDGSTDGSTNNSIEAGWRERLQDPDISLEKLKNDAIALARHLEVSELELQALRKQVSKESKRGQDLSRELSGLREEMDAVRRECDELKSSQKKTVDMNTLQMTKIDGEDLRYVIEEIRQELSHEKNLNTNLRLQLQKTQESNSQLILAVKDMDELLEQKDRQVSSDRSRIMNLNEEINEDFKENGSIFLQAKCSKCKQGLSETRSQHDDEEQYALEVLVKEHDSAIVTYTAERQIIDLKSELELYRKDREDLEMQMEQLALDYEILKQENHDISSKFEQCQLREQLRMQYECTAHSAIINDLEFRIEDLEKELHKQAEAFEGDLGSIMRAKVEQEQRAMTAEEALKKTRCNNANAAERLQEEFKRLSAQVSASFCANEKLAMQAMNEANELRLEKNHIEELLQKTNEELELVQGRYHQKIQELSNLLETKTNERNELFMELESKCAVLERQKKSEEARQRASLEEILVLKAENERLSREKDHLFEQVQHKEDLVAQVERLQAALEESERMSLNKNLERNLLEQTVASLKEEVIQSSEELKYLRLFRDEQEMMLRTKNTEVETLKAHSAELNHSLHKNEKEKENQRTQVLNLKGELSKKEQKAANKEDKFKNSNAGVAGVDVTPKIAVRNTKSKSVLPSHTSNDIAGLLEKVGLLGLLEEINCGAENLKISNDYAKMTGEDQSKPSTGDKAALVGFSNSDRQLSMSVSENHLDIEQEGLSGTHDKGYIANILSEVAALKDQNKSMEAELKEMQERYSEISLKFAEVEGERQQLVMTIRSLKNAMKN